jgi:hypothetical protein
MSDRALRLVPLGFLFLLAGCGSPAPAIDAGPDDAPIEVPDAPSPADDAGDGICGDTSDSTLAWSPAPATCLPRCTRETFDAVSACTTTSCAQAALAADATPPTRVRTVNGVFELGCAGSGLVTACVAWQTYACQAEHCPVEFDTWTSCVNAGGPCDTELAALGACSSAPAPANCRRDLSRACYAP